MAAPSAPARAPSRAPALAIRDLVVAVPGLGRPALAIARLELPGAARVAITGPSGCGKTTLLNQLAGLARPGTGSLAWGDTDLTRLGEGARDRWRAAHVGLVMQDFHLFPGLSALDNVLLPQRLRHPRLPAGMPQEARRLLDRVGIGRLDQKVETLSRGQMQRVAVARALLARPVILIADEPTASLDAEAGAAVADLLANLADETGASLMVATHDPRLMARLDTELRLKDGACVPEAPACSA